MFSFNHSLFDVSDNFENFKQGIFDFPTTTHNSPGSLKTKSLKLEDSPFNCSFDEGSQANHASSVWDASIKYLQSTLNQFVDSVKGFNDMSLYNFPNVGLSFDDCSIQEMILKNDNLKFQQKHEFLSEISTQIQLKELMKELLSIFNENVFHQITYVIFKIWSKKNQSSKIEEKKQTQDQPLIPHFDCFWGYEDEEQPKLTWSPYFQPKSINEVIANADKCTEEIAQELYFDSRLRLLNLKDAKKECQNDYNGSVHFSQFFKVVARSVYLSSEGFFNQPQQEQTAMISQDFEFEMNDVCALQEFKLNENKFIRSFSQGFEDDEDDFEFNSIPSKKRKSQ